MWNKEETALSFDEAATISGGAPTAWEVLFDHGGLQAGQRVPTALCRRIKPLSLWRENYTKLLSEDGSIFLIGEQTFCSLTFACRYQALIAQCDPPRTFCERTDTLLGKM